MGLRDDFHTAVFDNLTQFIRMVRIVETNPQIKQVLEHAPAAMTRGRTLQQMAMDDAMSAFEDVMKNVPDKEIPITFYLQMMRARDNNKLVSPSDAATRLRTNLAAKRGAASAAKPLDEKQSDHIPDFLRIVFQQAPLTLVEALANNWSAVVQNFGRLTMREEDLAAGSKALDIADYMAKQVNDKLESRIKSENTLRGMQGAAGAGGKQINIPGIDPRLQQLLSMYGEDLTAMARGGTLPKTIARDAEVTQLLAAVVQKDSPYALSVGPDGSGKTAVTAGLAHRIVEGKVPAKLKDAVVIHLKLKEMKATSGQGQKQDPRTGEVGIIDQFNERLHYILSKVSEHNERSAGPQIIINITELGDIANRIPGYFQAKDVLAANMEKAGALRLVAEIPEQKFNQVEVEARDVLQRFQIVRIKPLGLEDTVTLLERDAESLKKATGVETPRPLFGKIFKIATRFLPALAQPASSLDTLEASVAYAEVNSKKVVEEDHVVSVVSNLTGVPKEFIGSSMSERIKTLGEELPKKVMGQDTAIREIVESLEIANSNLQDAKKPLGSYLMIGPTGVGKSETAKALAEHLGVPLFTEDMANYMDQHAKAKMVGSPPGYVGFDKEASMEKVAKSPYCVLLLDEIEKAHPDIFNLLLSVLDEGRLQLMNGKTVDFKNCIILMSSNLGAKDAESARDKKSTSMIKKRDGNSAADKTYTQAIENKLPPEFINRLDGILRYNRLADEVIYKIALKKIQQISEFLADKNPNLRLEFTKAAEQDLYELGHDPRYGARPMDRAVKKYLKTPLSKWLMENGDKVREPTTLLVKSLKDGFVMTPEKARNAPRPAP